MNTTTLLAAFLFMGVLDYQLQLFGQDQGQGQGQDRVAASHTLPDDATKAWAEVAQVFPALRAPDAWRTNEPSPEEVAEFQKQVRQTALSFAEKAREFIVRFPTNENVGDARITVVHALSHAVAAGMPMRSGRLQRLSPMFWPTAVFRRMIALRFYYIRATQP